MMKRKQGDATSEEAWACEERLVCTQEKTIPKASKRDSAKVVEKVEGVEVLNIVEDHIGNE